MVIVLVGVFSRDPDPFGASALPYFDLRDHAMHLLYPALALAVFQIPFIANARTFAGLLGAFAQALPEILGALVVTEAMFAWPGDGRLFYEAMNRGGGSVAVALVLVAAFAVLLVRVPVTDG